MSIHSKVLFFLPWPMLHFPPCFMNIQPVFFFHYLANRQKFKQTELKTTSMAEVLCGKRASEGLWETKTSLEKYLVVSAKILVDVVLSHILKNCEVVILSIQTPKRICFKMCIWHILYTVNMQCRNVTQHFS